MVVPYTYCVRDDVGSGTKSTNAELRVGRTNKLKLLPNKVLKSRCLLTVNVVNTSVTNFQQYEKKILSVANNLIDICKGQDDHIRDLCNTVCHKWPKILPVL